MNSNGILFHSFFILMLLSAAGCGGEGETSDGGNRLDSGADVGADSGGQPTSDPCVYTPQDIPAPKIHTPRWAFEPWISKDISNAEDTYDFVNGFRDRGIPVGVVVIDSPWETNYNTFIPNPRRYPGFDKMISDMHARGVRVVTWVTQMINESSWDVETGGDSYDEPSPNLAQARTCSYLVNDGAVYNWWKGYGSGVDFLNPNAVIWWHRQQNRVLDMGLDGWKLDFGDSYIDTPTVKTYAGGIPHQQYSEAYYRDYLAYGLWRKGTGDFVTMVRPYDKSYQFDGRFFARPEHAPVGWVGDNTRDWAGLADALDHVFRSAEAGYVVLGSDIGGYLDRDDTNLTGPVIPFSQDVFVRWTAAGALMPFMELHGRANITPWTVPERPEETVAIYRYWSALHSELVPFFYSLAEEAYSGGKVIIRPVGKEHEWPGDYRYMIGDALLVAPLLDGTGKRDVALPGGASWYDWWNPQAGPVDGGRVLASYDASDQKRIPLFVRSGAILPMRVTTDKTGIGDAGYDGNLTVLVYPAGAATSFPLRDEDGRTCEIAASGGETAASIDLACSSLPVILHARSESAFKEVKAGGKTLNGFASAEEWKSAASGWYYDPAIRMTRIKIGKITGPVKVTLGR